MQSAPDHSGQVVKHSGICPLARRVTPDAGAPAESAEGATAAWRALLAREGGRPGDVARLSGPRLFGLDHPAVQRAVRALPHAARCARFDAWLGPRPDAEPLVRFLSHFSPFKPSSNCAQGPFIPPF